MFTAADDAAAGIPVKRAPYPDGEAGIRGVSIETMLQKIREGASTAVMKSYAGNVLKAAGFPRSVRDRAAALLAHVRSHVTYAPDAQGTEQIQSAQITLCVDGAPVCIPIGDCFPEGTLLLRRDGQLVAIEEIEPGDEIWGYDRWSRVEAKAFKGTLKVDAIELNNGSTVFLTPDHHVYAARSGGGAFERVRVVDLHEDDLMLQPERIAFGETRVDPDRAYVEGLALADGWVQSNTSFRIAGRDGKRKEKQKHEVATICARLGIPTLMHKRYITVKDSTWAQRLLRLGARARFKRAETVGLDEAGAAALLRGLMADSTANTNGPGRTYSTTSRIMAAQVRVLHRMFGVSTSVRMLTPEQHGGAGDHPLWRVGVRVKDRTDGKAEKRLRVRSIERGVRRVSCWDIQTDDHRVYLPEHDVTVSNCDDLTIALATLCGAAGMDVRVVRQHFGGELQQHVLCEVRGEGGEWIALDPSSSKMPAGVKAHAVRETYHSPWEDTQTGVAQAEFVGIGRRLEAGTVQAEVVSEEEWQRVQARAKRGLAGSPFADVLEPYDVRAFLARKQATLGFLGELLEQPLPPMDLKTTVAAGVAIVASALAVAAVVSKTREKRKARR